MDMQKLVEYSMQMEMEIQIFYQLYVALIIAYLLSPLIQEIFMIHGMKFLLPTDGMEIGKKDTLD